MATMFDDILDSDPTLVIESIDALDGNDLVRIAIAPGDKRTISVEGGAGFDTLSITFRSMSLTPSSVVADGGTLTFQNSDGTYTTVAYSGFEALEISGWDLDDTHLIVLVTGNTVDDLYISGGGEYTTGVDIRSGGGGDRIEISSFVDGSVDGGAGDDFIDARGLQRQFPHQHYGPSLLGGDGNDLLYGSPYRDRLAGGPGADRMEGGARDDYYVVDDLGDQVVESALGGRDTVESSISYTLPAEVEILRLVTSMPLSGTGNGLANSIYGNAGANVLDGGGGADLLYGGDGNDTYVVDGDDVAIETSAAGGIDRVVSSGHYALGAHIERLVLAGSASVSAIGNDLDNEITGNAGANLLDGRGGGDRMTGGDGDDTYVIDDPRDRAIETSATGGVDQVNSSLGHTLGSHFENLKLLGTGDVHAIGNDLDNVVTGNAGANLINGRAGADRMTGGDGDDLYYVDDAGDKAVEVHAGGGNDTVRSTVSFQLGPFVDNLELIAKAAIDGTGNKDANRLIGNDAANVLNGGEGADLMKGGDGDDTYLVDDPGDRAIETRAAGGTDTVHSSISFQLGAFVEDLVLTGTAAIDGTGNDLANRITGTSGANVLDGRGGADTMAGVSGDDTYIVNHAGDQAIETSAAGGYDHVLSFVSFTLGANLESLKLAGSQPLDGHGNDLANLIVGNTSANLLTGGGGNDVLNGGPGNDRLFGGAGDDVLHGGSGADGFYFDAPDGVDLIDDFAAEDTIHLSQAGFGALPLGALDPAAFRTGTAAADADDRIVYDAASGQIWYDADGSGAGAAILFAQLSPGTPLTAADFVLF